MKAAIKGGQFSVSGVPGRDAARKRWRAAKKGQS
jgi:hypothetical protein